MKLLSRYIILIFTVVLLVGCNSESKVEDTISEKTIEEPKRVIDTNETIEEITEDEIEEIESLPEGMAINPLSGLPVKEEAVAHRPVAVTINNLYSALPQSGISKADIIYETLAEGGITRLIAVFQDLETLEKVGPIRSARRYFLDIALDLDAIYVHYGQDPALSGVHAVLGDANLNGLSYLDAIMCWRDNSRKAPHNVYASGEKIKDAWETVGYREEKKENYPLMFDFSDEEIEDLSLDAKKVIIPYSNYVTAEFVYDEESKIYYKFHFNEKHIDEYYDEQISTKNIIIQEVNIYNRPGDTEGRLDMELIGSGNGYYITNGKYIPITWTKTGQYEPTQFYNEEGDNLEVNKGKTWISIVDIGTPISFEK